MKQKTISSVLLSPLSTLLILCVTILSQLTFVSCKDEDLTEEEKQQKQEQENDRQFLLTSEFWQVVGQLSNAEVLPDDWQHATFEPGIGEASDKSSTTRIVLTNEAEAAAESFENLTGADVSNLSSYEWKRDFGSLTYQRLHDGTGWAAVDVDIKQMPGLKRIIYCTPEQQGLNASVPGTPYYRFGDVIKKLNEDGKWEYWVCVRPCFGPEKKGDMHWMCLGNLPEKNIKSYTYTKQNRTWYWPVSLTTNYEHIKNLSEMTCAILEPVRWADHYERNQDEKLFHDFSYANIKYHNRYFWQLVQDAWNTPVPSEGGKTVFELLFHRDKGQLLDGKQQLNFFYGSASGPGTFSWYMNLNLISVIVRTADSKGFQCRDLVKKTSNKSCEKKEFDIREYSEKGYSTKASDISFIEPGAYVYPLRYATGKQLFGSQPNYYQTMDGANGIHDVYVFNKHYAQSWGSDTNMKVFEEGDVQKLEIQTDDANGHFYGISFWRIGDVVKDTEGSLWFCIQPSGCGKDCDKDDAQALDYYSSNHSYFISLTPNHYEGTNQYRTNLPTLKEATSISMLLSQILYQGKNPFSKAASPLTLAIDNINEYAKVNLEKFFVVRDTLHNENGPNDKPQKNHVTAYCTNLAYSDASHAAQGKQGLLRHIYSNASRGYSKEGEIIYGVRYTEYINWDRYEYGNQETMFLQDLTSMDKVEMYASGDRWVTLPFYTEGNEGSRDQETGEYLDIYEHQQPRQSCYRSISCNIFDWDQNKKDFQQPDNLSMYNEPIIFCRLMAVHDIGKEEITSTDKRKFEVVKLVQPDNITVVEERSAGLCDASYIQIVNTTNHQRNFYNGTRCRGYMLGEPQN